LFAKEQKTIAELRIFLKIGRIYVERKIVRRREQERVKNEKRNKWGRGTRQVRGMRRKVRKTELIQLTVTIVLLAAALIGRTVMPNEMKVWKELIIRDADLLENFSEFGKAAAEGGFLDAFGELCIDVFGGE